jgi:hypothetical protein
MRWFVIFCLGLLSLAHASEARACSCMKLSPSEGLSSSEAVFTGEVIDVQPNEATRFGGLEVTLRVKEVWKGAIEEEVKVHTAGSGAACGYGFAKGLTYLVYVVRDDADPMRVSLCSRTAPIEDAKEDLAFLGKPLHRFDDQGAHRKSKDANGGSEGKCSASRGSTGGADFRWLAMLLAAVVLARRRFA